MWHPRRGSVHVTVCPKNRITLLLRAPQCTTAAELEDAARTRYNRAENVAAVLMGTSSTVERGDCKEATIVLLALDHVLWATILATATTIADTPDEIHLWVGKDLEPGEIRVGVDLPDVNSIKTTNDSVSPTHVSVPLSDFEALGDSFAAIRAA